MKLSPSDKLFEIWVAKEPVARRLSFNRSAPVFNVSDTDSTESFT